jgi:hypothetical protein
MWVLRSFLPLIPINRAESQYRETESLIWATPPMWQAGIFVYPFCESLEAQHSRIAKKGVVNATLSS